MLDYQLRDVEVIASVARYYTLTRAQINRLHFPNDHDGRLTRKRLRILHEAGLINRANMQVTNPLMGSPGYVYYPSAKGCDFLAQEKENPNLKDVCTRTPNWMHMYHYVAIADAHILLDQAIQKSTAVAIDHWISEWDVLNAEEKEPEKRYRLYTKLGQKLVCAPDAAFLLAKDGFRKVFYVELDRDTTESSDRVAAQKCQGFAGLFEKRAHLHKHFPMANVEKFTVLFIVPTVRRRDALRASFSNKPAPWMYKFAALVDLKPETFLTERIWYPCVGDPAALVKEGGQG